MKNAGVKVGLFFGALMAIQTIVSYLLNIPLNSQKSTGMIIFILAIIVCVIAVFLRRKELNNTLSFSQGIGASVLSMLVSMGISAVVFYLLYYVVDAKALADIENEIMDQVTENMDLDAFTDEQLESVMSWSKTMFRLGPALTVPMYAILGLIVGAIASAFLKREPSPFENQEV